jgi:hypothetical protein
VLSAMRGGPASQMYRGPMTTPRLRDFGVNALTD